ncbi:MAG: efflux RND transporter permease subunit [Planctomycetota bacterium]|nr:efflux RND transporter permease subunit [Planctomycetota bacterium]
MKSLIQWSIKNSPAMNTLMISSLIVGLVSLMLMRREVFPEFELEIIVVTVPYPGASPEDIEEGICQKIEEKLSALKGLKKMTSVAREGAGYLVLELNANIKDVQKVLNEVKAEIEQITEFPEFAEEPDVQQITFRTPAIKLGIIAPNREDRDPLLAERELREITEQIRTELLQLPPPPPSNPIAGMVGLFSGASGKRTAISSVSIVAEKSFQIDVQVKEEKLREYGLTLQQVAQVISAEDLDLPAGKITTAGQEILIRGKSKSSVGDEVARIKLIPQEGGDALTVGDVADVIDGFSDEVSIHRINGQPGLALSVERTADEDLLVVCGAVKDYLRKKEQNMPSGYKLVYWGDTSVDVADRMNLLIRNGLQGLLLVFIVLAVFLELKLAFWVALGIPVSILGSGYILLGAGQTLNMLSMFAFLMALGIVVDDAIVIGENIYEHRQRGKKFLLAALEGTTEVLPSVCASVATTIIAFMPLMFVTGVMGKFIAVMPLAVIAMLVISLLESTFILPCHLAHDNNLFIRILRFFFRPVRFLELVFNGINRVAGAGMNWFIESLYLPALRWSLGNRMVIIVGAISMLLFSVGFIASGLTPFVGFPKLDSRVINGTVVFPDGSPKSRTLAATDQIEKAINELNEEYKAEFGREMVHVTYRSIGQIAGQGALGRTGVTSGGHVGNVEVELTPVSEREWTSQEIVDRWRTRVEANEISGTEIIKFGAAQMGPGGASIEFQMQAPKTMTAELEKAIEDCKAKLRSYDGVIDVEDDSRPGKAELQIGIKDSARGMDVSLSTVARAVRASYYGQEAKRTQRGRHEVKIMVRYPRERRRSMQDFENILIGSTPVTELANFSYSQGYSEINRVDQKRTITISADVEKGTNAFEIVQDFKNNYLRELLEKNPGLYVRWEGQAQQNNESFSSLFSGVIVAFLAMFVLLTIEFRTYMQPLIILGIIPFGVIGAIIGHYLLGLELTLFSFFGLVALTGVIVNDSIVLVDFINTRYRSRMPLRQALLEAGRRRFRPVVLTSMTTIAGLSPILIERSFQAQVLIPMAASLCFGLLVATSLILILVPVFYDVYRSIVGENAEEPDFDVPPTDAA